MRNQFFILKQNECGGALLHSGYFQGGVTVLCRDAESACTLDNPPVGSSAQGLPERYKCVREREMERRQEEGLPMNMSYDAITHMVMGRCGCWCWCWFWWCWL